jgi:hypothetical protein
VEQPHWLVPFQPDPERAPLDLKGIAWPRSILTDSVSDLLSPVGSRSYGRKREGEGAHREGVDGEGHLGVLDVDEVRDGVQL